MNDDRLRQLVQQAFPPVGHAPPSRDLWPDVAERIERRHGPAVWFDLALAAAVAAALALAPEWLVLLLFHL
jgi:hypothetical protein